MDERKLLGIYLDDHLAVLAGGRALARRTLRETQDAALRRFLGELLPELEEDAASVAGRIRSLGREPSALKQRLARLGERAGRLKPNGRLVSPSPLSRLVELEGLEAILGASRALWRALERAAGAEGDEEAARLAARAEDRLAELERLRLEVAASVLGGRRPGTG